MSNYRMASIESLINSKSCRSGHLFDYRSEMKSRDADGLVSCRCARCGKEFKASCGVNLSSFGKLAPLYQYGVMYA